MLAHLPDGDFHRGRKRPHSHQHNIGIVGLIFLEERIAVGAAQDPLEIGVGFLDDAKGPFHGRVVLAPDFHHPIFVGLRGHGDGIVGMEQQVSAVVTRQELIHFFLRWNFDQRLRVGQEGAVATDCAGQEYAPILRYAIGDQGCVQRFLCVVHPDQLPAEIADRQRVVVLDAKCARVVQGPVTYHDHHGNAQRGCNR